MATAVERVRDASRLDLSLGFHFQASASGLPDSLLPKGDRTRAGICIQKPTGQLEFTLNTSNLQISALEKDFDILFVGMALDDKRISWSPKLPRGPVSVTIKGFGDATISSVAGSLTTSSSVTAPPFSQACAGEQRAYVADLATPTPGMMSASAGFGTINITGLTVTGRVGDPEAISVAIQAHEHSECIGPPVEGATEAFSAVVDGVPIGAAVTYEWAVAGGVPQGPTDRQTVNVVMPAAPATVALDLTITVAEANRDVSLAAPTFTASVIDTQLAGFIESFCKIMLKTPSHMFVRPLWDPLKDLVTRPVTQDEVAALRDFGRRLTSLVDVLSGPRRQ